MNLKSISFGSAIAAAAVTLLSSAPAQAVGLTGRLSINLDGAINSITSTGVDFNNSGFTLQAPAGGAITGSFAPYIGGTVLLQDLNFGTTLVNNVEQNLSINLPAFITLQQSGLTDLSFDLTQLVAAEIDDIIASTGLPDEFNAELRGIFRPSGIPNDSSIDQLVVFRLAGGSNGGAIELTPVPTPALLPAALGFGAALLRKRKGEQAAQEKETVDVKA